MAENDSEFEIPDELIDKLSDFRESFEKIKEILDPLQTFNINSTDNEVR